MGYFVPAHFVRRACISLKALYFQILRVLVVQKENITNVHGADMEGNRKRDRPRRRWMYGMKCC